MTQQITDKTSVLAKFMFDLITANMGALGLSAVYYGNQVMIPDTPVVVVTPGPKQRELAGVSAPGGRTDNYMTVYVDVLSQVVKPETTAAQDLDDLADDVEAFLHQDVTMDGLIIHGFVNLWEPGLTFLQNGQFRMVRLNFVGRSKTYLSPA